MKKIILALLILASMVHAKKPIGMAADDRVPPTNQHTVAEVENGRAMSLIYSGTTTIAGKSTSGTTIWMHTGWTDADGVNAEAQSAKTVSRFDPTAYTLLIDLSSTDDSVGLATARFETAVDTTDDPGWNPDLTNFFIQDGNADSSFYGQWLFEEISAKRSVTTAGAFATGEIYRIVTVGNTTFTDIGATENAIGVVFVATAAGSGTGTAAGREASATFAYPLRVLYPGWIRFVFTTGTLPDDAVTIDWKLICKNGG
jgi:hypothetical protein